jgi:glucose-1-phosphate cytidylyltransferase
MKIYSHYGYTDFIICCGYKGYVIKEYFANYFLHMSNVTIDMKNNKIEVHQRNAEPWKVTLVDTGESTMTGGRVKQIKNFVENDDFFHLTYGDGLSNINIDELVDFYKSSKLKAILTAALPPARFGALEINDHKVIKFKEKPKGDGSYVSAGFFIMNKSLFNYLEDENTILEQKPLETLANEGELGVFKFNGFWYAMDTLRDKKYLEDLWHKNCPWKVW